MARIKAAQAQGLMRDTFDEFAVFLRRNKGLMGRSVPPQLSLILADLPDWESITADEGLFNELFSDLSAEGYNYLLGQCFELADLYRLSTRDRLREARVEDPESQPEPVSAALQMDRMEFVQFIQIADFMSRVEREADRVYRVFSGIASGLNDMRDDEGYIISGIESEIESLPRTFKFLEGVLPFFRHPNNRAVIEEFLRAVADTDPRAVREEATANAAIRQLNAHIERMARSACELSDLAGKEARSEPMSEDEIARMRENGANVRWIDQARENISSFFADRRRDWDEFVGWLDRSRFSAGIDDGSPYVSLEISDTTILEAMIDLSSFVTGLTLKHIFSDSTTIKFLLNYDIADRDITASMNINRNFDRMLGLTGFDAGGSVSCSNSGMEVTFDIGKVLSLNRFSNVRIWIEATPLGNNPGMSAGARYSTETGGFQAMTRASSNSTGAEFSTWLRLGENLSVDCNFQMFFSGNEPSLFRITLRLEL